MLDLKLVQRYLMLNFWVMAGVCLLIVVLYETEVLLPLEQFDNPQLEFFLQVERRVNNASTYNKIWSPGKRIFMEWIK